ncbi:melanotransferrin-like isoform X2 [Petromyzon marinus]|uniref:melanotransferrin-like isoform X2 n=1 Tax=Petromyzon marinus TaxID=7757 RepID=UPI003F6F80BC
MLVMTKRVHTSLRWCTISTGEESKCTIMKTALSTAGISPPLLCVRAADRKECMQKIEDGFADAVTLDSGEVFSAGKYHGLQVAAAEAYTADIVYPTYHAVAVVHKAAPASLTFGTLRGTRSCHTGLGRTAGWVIPVGRLRQSGEVKGEGCDIPKEVASFFNASCVPGAGNLPPSLCQLCIGNEAGDEKCAASNHERFFGYTGAFRCLASGSGDVAFVKHTTVTDNTDGHNPDEWAHGLLSTDFELLCPSGNRQPVTGFESCNLAKVPPHAVVTRSSSDPRWIFDVLDAAQKQFGSDNGTRFKMFDSSGFQGTDLLFKDSTVSLFYPEGRLSYKEWLGGGFLESMQGMDCNGARPAAVSSVALVAVATALWAILLA